MNLAELQRVVFDVIRQPLTPAEHMRQRMADGRSTKAIAESIIKPNDRLTSAERLEIYNRVYWFRILSSLAEDFVGLRAVIGERQFDKIAVAYLAECPSESFTLRNLGSRLELWLRRHPGFAPKKIERLAIDMVRLEWMDIEAFDAAELPKLSENSLRSLGEDPSFRLQPYVRLLDLDYPVDNLLLSIREREEEHETDIVSNVVNMRTSKPRRKRLSLPKPEKVYLAVHRQENTVYFKRLAPEAFALIRALGEGQALSQAIEASVNWSNQSVELVSEQLHDWFANWAELGWFAKLS